MDNRKTSTKLKLEKDFRQFQIKKNIIQDSYDVAEKMWKMNMKPLALELLKKLEALSPKESSLIEVFFKNYREEILSFYETEFENARLVKTNPLNTETLIFPYFQGLLFNKITSHESFEELLKKSPFNRFSTLRVLYNFKLEGVLEISPEK